MDTFIACVILVAALLGYAALSIVAAATLLYSAGLAVYGAVYQAQRLWRVFKRRKFMFTEVTMIFPDKKKWSS